MIDEKLVEIPETMEIADAIDRLDSATQTAVKEVDSDAETKPTHSIECQAISEMTNLQVCDLRKVAVGRGSDQYEDNLRFSSVLLIHEYVRGSQDIHSSTKFVHDRLYLKLTCSSRDDVFGNYAGIEAGHKTSIGQAIGEVRLESRYQLVA